MNENTQALAHQAGFDLGDQDQRFLINSLVELVLEECCQILARPEGLADQSMVLSRYNQGFVEGRQLAIEQIEEHFGLDCEEE
jgi:hypothetical protein